MATARGSASRTRSTSRAFQPALGSACFADAPPASQHAAVVRALLEAGCRIVGKTNMHELTFGVTGINRWSGTLPQTPVRLIADSGGLEYEIHLGHQVPSRAMPLQALSFSMTWSRYSSSNICCPRRERILCLTGLRDRSIECSAFIRS